MRTYIFTDNELEVIQKYLQTRRRTPPFNKLLHLVRHNTRLLNHVQIFLTLLSLAKAKRKKERAKLPPGRPPKTKK